MKEPRDYGDFGIRSGTPIYRQFDADPDVFRFVSKPQDKASLWESFEP